MMVFYMKKKNFRNFSFILSYQINEDIEFLSFYKKNQLLEN